MLHAFTLPVDEIRDLFPLLRREGPRGDPLVYLDSAATALRSRDVIEAVTDALAFRTGGVHRSVHLLGDEATALYEGARRKVARLLGAIEEEIVLVRNATEALNVIARGFRRRGRTVVSLTDHHSCVLPWPGEVTRLAPLKDGTLDVAALERELGRGDVSIVALSHVSNVTGAMIDAPAIAGLVHRHGGVFVLDAAQSVPHAPTDVSALGCDFLAFSGHKLGAPGGIGVLYGRADLLAELAPHAVGGGTVERVTSGDLKLRPAPWCFEAGTPALEASAGLSAAIELVESIGREAIAARERALASRLVRSVEGKVSGVRVVGPADAGRSGIVSFALEGVSAHVVARVLSDAYGICVRSGFHCAEPLHEALGLGPTLRASFYVYNTEAEVDRFVGALGEVLSVHRVGHLGRNGRAAA